MVDGFVAGECSGRVSGSVPRTPGVIFSDEMSDDWLTWAGGIARLVVPNPFVPESSCV